MKIKARSSSVLLCLSLAFVLSVVAVATSIAPSNAHARARLESTQPLAGDPDTPESPSSGLAKAARISTVGRSQAQYAQPAPTGVGWAIPVLYLRIVATAILMIRRI
jgi:hypothetical protein